MTGVESARPTRRTVTIVEDDGTATALNEDGEEWAAADWPLMRAAFDDLLLRSEPGVVVLTGSVPPGTPATAYADCVAAAHDRGFTTIVDCSGPHLIAAIEAGAHVVKPNRHELLATVGAEGMEGVRRLREQAPQMTVVASDGPPACCVTGRRDAGAPCPRGPSSATRPAQAMHLWPRSRLVNGAGRRGRKADPRHRGIRCCGPQSRCRAGRFISRPGIGRAGSVRDDRLTRPSAAARTERRE